MMERFKGINKIEKRILYGYFILEAVIFFLIKWAEFTQPYTITGKVMYSAIVLNFCVMAYFFIRKTSKDFVRNGKNHWIPLAISMTLIADYFLTYTDTHFYAGVFCFCIVQLFYACQLGWNSRNLLVRAGLFVVFVLIMSECSMNARFSLLCGCSIAMLTGNVVDSWYKIYSLKKDAPNWDSSLLLAIGLTLFMGCDLSLGFRIMSDGVRQLSMFHDVMNYLTWVFYLPSQVILILSFVVDENNESQIT